MFSKFRKLKFYKTWLWGNARELLFTNSCYNIYNLYYHKSIIIENVIIINTIGPLMNLFIASYIFMRQISLNNCIFIFIIAPNSEDSVEISTVLGAISIKNCIFNHIGRIFLTANNLTDLTIKNVRIHNTMFADNGWSWK